MRVRRIVDTPEFFRFAKGRTTGDVLDPAGNQVAVARDSLAAVDPGFDLERSADRTIPYLFSTEGVARDGHTVSVTGFDLTGFNANPVFLWAHDSEAPPIGRVTGITRTPGFMRGVVEYVERDLYPFGDMIFRMVKKRFLSATSISWLPLEWKFTADRNRPGGIDFKRQDLLEISQVPVPAQITALAAARAAGIDTSPMVQWAERLLDSGQRAVISRAELERMRVVAKTGELDAARLRRIRLAHALALGGSCP